MKRSWVLAIVGVFIWTVSGASSVCHAQETKTQTKGKTGMGALVGGLLGATAGGVIGHDSGKTTEGVLIGGAIGALGGAAVGSQMKTTTPVATATPVNSSSTSAAVSEALSGVETPKVTMKQVIYWSEQGVDSEEIMARIKKSGATFVLTQDDVRYLERRGVSPLVIEVMQGK